ncbi:MAG: hypothetical protein IH946_11245, partial [Bacteroidetes bacterium]|nr:hypothetical protein [Bacteroidota bacterium]
MKIPFTPYFSLLLVILISTQVNGQTDSLSAIETRYIPNFLDQNYLYNIEKKYPYKENG